MLQPPLPGKAIKQCFSPKTVSKFFFCHQWTEFQQQTQSISDSACYILPINPGGFSLPQRGCPTAPASESPSTGPHLSPHSTSEARDPSSPVLPAALWTGQYPHLLCVLRGHTPHPSSPISSLGVLGLDPCVLITNHVPLGEFLQEPD